MLDSFHHDVWVKENDMNEISFECRFDCGDFDALYYEYICEHTDNWTKGNIDRIIESGDMYEDFKEHMIYNWA